MRLTAICSVSTFGIGLALAAGLGEGGMRLPTAQVPPPTLRFPAPSLRPVPLPRLTIPHTPSPRAFGDVMPHSYLIYGLRAGGPGGMACTDRNGAVLPMPFHPQVYMGPLTARPFSPQVLPHTFTLPKITLPKLALPNLTPKK